MANRREERGEGKGKEESANKQIRCRGVMSDRKTKD